MDNKQNSVRVTFNLPEEVEDMLTTLYISRLKNKSPGRVSRSTIVAEAIREKYQKDI